MSLADSFAEFRRLTAEHRPQWGAVLGSGLGSIADGMESLATCHYRDLPGLPDSKVSGHAGKFTLARLGEELVLLACGRVHLYEGWSAQEVCAHVRFMGECGVRKLVLTNAAGTLNPRHAPGNWMLITDQINFTGVSPLMGGPNFVDMSEIYSRRLRERFLHAAREEALVLHQGIYAGVVGPQYETPAEIRMFGRLGADAVGMSTVLEAIQARSLGMEVAGLSCLTNWAAGLSPAPIGHEEVMAMGRQAAHAFRRLFGRVLSHERRAEDAH